jgi:hypothetical protein
MVLKALICINVLVIDSLLSASKNYLVCVGE